MDSEGLRFVYKINAWEGRDKYDSMQQYLFFQKSYRRILWAGLSRPRKDDKDDYISGDGLSKARGGIGNQANTIQTNRE